MRHHTEAQPAGAKRADTQHEPDNEESRNLDGLKVDDSEQHGNHDNADPIIEASGAVSITRYSDWAPEIQPLR